MLSMLGYGGLIKGTEDYETINMLDKVLKLVDRSVALVELFFFFFKCHLSFRVGSNKISTASIISQTLVTHSDLTTWQD